MLDHVRKDLFRNRLFARGKELFVSPIVFKSGDVIAGIFLRPGVPVATHLFQLLVKSDFSHVSGRNSHCNAPTRKGGIC